MGLSLGLDQPQRNVRLLVEDVVGPLCMTPTDELAAHDDVALAEAHLLADLQHLFPPGLAQRGRDELRAHLAFGEASLVHAGHLLLAWSHGSITSIPQPA